MSATHVLTANGCGSLIILFYTAGASDAASVCAPAVAASPSSPYRATLLVPVSRSCWGFMGCGSLIILFYTA